MVDQHICQLKDEMKIQLIHSLGETLKKFQALEPKKKPLYKEEDVPMFLKKRVPKFKLNHELWPLICSSSTLEIRFTTKPEASKNQNEDPSLFFAKIDTPGSPYRSNFVDDMCEKAQALGAVELPSTKSGCPVHDVIGAEDVMRAPYQCTHDDKCPGIVVCTNPETGESYLCTIHVQAALKKAN